ncbi:hypothetical protein PAXRUDRAFT_821963 [Paxillus rubicundulus Ve08.2h10]|uniref:Uncharacterized protein n=1 Tax=Paxillus rubicundulus Ve08.2h10 TaxID=930991 RepID=A0A0D0DMW8_9AGAM|nr:hypothetical protein PAXRUDRAFT_821963 [Paxillus rubicundulus Ve08.2h10]
MAIQIFMEDHRSSPTSTFRVFTGAQTLTCHNADSTHLETFLRTFVRRTCLPRASVLAATSVRLPSSFKLPLT